VKPLSPTLSAALRSWGEDGTVHLAHARALATRGLVRDAQPGIGCRLPSCWPLTVEGRVLQAELRTHVAP
jgi:hypothetical protein